jgi:O-antigen/teichoic acid export membrane protein
MNPLKGLASQTAIYGVSSIVGRFLNYLLVPLFTYYFSPAEYGVVSEFYAYMGFLAVLLLFGFETGYFRFRQGSGDKARLVYPTALRFVCLANVTFFLAVLAFSDEIAGALDYSDHPEYVWWTAGIVAMDSSGAVAFARLRAENKAARFAAIKLTEIAMNVLLNLFFIVYCRHAHLEAPDSLAGSLWNPQIGVGYIFLANLAASGVKLVLLTPQLRGVLVGFDRELLGRMLRYSLPMVIIGFAGIVNEMLDRAVLKYLLPYDLHTNLKLLGIYSACYKLSIVMSLFIQAFRYAAEPFFFAFAGNREAPKTYAEVLNYFVIFCVFIFLAVAVYLDIFKYFIGEPFRVGLQVVPILLIANIFLGIYVNLSIWYKLSDRTAMGALVALGGAGITVTLLFWWVPLMGYVGAAWATLVCYAGMALISYALGRRYYPVPYDIKRVTGYLLFGLGLYAADRGLVAQTGVNTLVSGTLCLVLYVAVALWADGRRLVGRLAAA